VEPSGGGSEGRRWEVIRDEACHSGTRARMRARSGSERAVVVIERVRHTCDITMDREMASGEYYCSWDAANILIYGQIPVPPAAKKAQKQTEKCIFQLQPKWCGIRVHCIKGTPWLPSPGMPLMQCTPLPWLGTLQ
jgi:hypothetical protein